MQAEATILDRLTHVYVSYRAARLLCMLAVPGVALLLFLLSGGFPPWSWRLLAQTMPNFPALLALRGQSTLLALAGLVLLALTVLLAWWGLLLLVWRMLAYGIKRHRELRRFAADMQEAQYLAQEAKGQYAPNSPYISPFRATAYAYRDEGYEDDGHEDQPGAFWADEDEPEADEPAPPPLRVANTSYALRPVAARTHRSARAYTDDLQSAGAWGYPEHLHTSAQQEFSDNLQLAGSRAYTENLHSAGPLVSTDNLQYTGYGMVAPAMPSERLPAPSVPLVPYELASVPTLPLQVVTLKPAETLSTTQLLVSTGLDEGLKRKGKPNEDSLLAVQNTRILRGASCPVGLFVIADGMGGHEKGQEASSLVVQSLSATVAPSLLAGPVDDNYAELLAEGVHHANLALYQRNRKEKADMGTTLAAALIINTTAYIVNVGDSRVYLYRAASGLSQVTRDHSTVARLIETGVLRPEEIYTHPRRNEIYRSLGHQASQEVDSFILALQSGDLLLLCSDGLWEMVRDTQIEQILASTPDQPAELSAALVQAALDGGGKDNISVIVVYVQGEEEARAAWAS